MRYVEAHRSEHQSNGLSALAVWLKKVFPKGREKKEKQRNIDELQKLSHHLLDDLGLGYEAEPLCWSSYAYKRSKSSSVQHGDQRNIGCEHHCRCENAVGC